MESLSIIPIGNSKIDDDIIIYKGKTDRKWNLKQKIQ